MYDVVFIGNDIKSPSLSSFQINPAQLLTARGEIGNFYLKYKDDKEDLNEVETRAVVINIEAEKETPATGLLSFERNLDNILRNTRKDYIVIVQDYNELAPAIVSKEGLEKAIDIRKRFPDLNVYYFYRSMRFIDNNDRRFEQARKMGIVFLKYERDNLKITDSRELIYNREDINLKLKDNIIMAPELKPAAVLDRVARIFNLRKSEKGYLQPENIYLQPTLSGKRGVYVLGGARGTTGYSNLTDEVEFTLNEIRNKTIDPVIEQERVVDDQKCILCYNCYRICNHGAIERDEVLDAMKINYLACQGCNACIARCPAGAISIAGSEDKKQSKGLKVMMCENSAQPAWKKAGNKVRTALNLEIEEIPCACSIKKEDLFNHLSNPENRLLILGCFEESCKHINGDKRGQQVVDEVKATLEKLDLNPERLTFKRLSPRMTADLEYFLSAWKEDSL